ncbi:hypothetical protein [Pseudarthrobacter sp. CCNWLW207]|uniref:hypothetical protein n=1 Tax=Pseudarthrobacter sp. CCNWLW207 TaxID=3127468 RepID=UPI0030786CB7
MMKVLAAVSLTELILQLIGARKAIRGGIPYDAPIGRGKPEDVARDMWATGSGLSAPWHTLAAHAAGTALLIARPRPWVRQAVGLLGVLYILGISWERITRESFRHPDRETTPLIASGLALSVAMALLGLRRKRR